MGVSFFPRARIGHPLAAVTKWRIDHQRSSARAVPGIRHFVTALPGALLKA